VILYPAIDLKDGQCVRLLQGEMESATIFNDDPANQACAFEAAGFSWLHIVDLNGAFAGEPINADAVAAILDAVSIPIQLGGGIRDLRTAMEWLDRGIRRVIFGTAAVKTPTIVHDARSGYVATEGWANASAVRATELVAEFENAGAAAIVYTDIERDGVMAGPNLSAIEDFAQNTKTPVIASGGVASLDDLDALKHIAPRGLDGVITGRALYDGRIEPAAALKLLAA